MPEINVQAGFDLRTSLVQVAYKNIHVKKLIFGNSKFYYL